MQMCESTFIERVVNMKNVGNEIKRALPMPMFLSVQKLIINNMYNINLAANPKFL